jgi:hypothetical protein
MGVSDNGLKYRADKGADFGEPQTRPSTDIKGAGITSMTPLNPDPHNTGLGLNVVQQRQREISRGRR